MNTHALMLAIIQQQDAEAAIAALVKAGLWVTRIGSLGGFLQLGNATLLMALEKHQIERAIALLKQTCVKRTTMINAVPSVLVDNTSYLISPIEVQVGGAIIFVLPVERVIRLGAPKQDQWTAPMRADGMKMLIAIASPEQAKSILNDLIQAQYRATLISTTGGFRRKGNATLLMGVKAIQVNDVLQRIEQTLGRVKTDSTARATIFVLDVERFEHSIGA
jgi:uncharacterized protein YaaQ